VITMPKNYNIITKTVRAKGTTGSAVVVGSSVAAGMTRYVTFLRVNQAAGAGTKGSKIWFCSTAASSTASTTAAALTAMKLMVLIPSAAGANKVVQIPAYPDPETPLFTIAASKWLSVRTSKLQLGSASCAVFVQYYDQ
jgi:hypothetical protein